MPRLCEFYPGICLTTEKKVRKNLSKGKKNLSQVKKNLSQSTVYILPKHPHITKPSQRAELIFESLCVFNQSERALKVPLCVTSLSDVYESLVFDFI